MGGVDLIVTDLDGTLWHTDDDIHPAATAALEEVRRRGPPLLVATGRRVTSTRVPLARLGAAPPAVVLNGALGLDLATGERFHRAPFTALQATRVLAGFRAVGLDPCLYVDDPTAEVLVSDAPSTNPGHLAALGETAAVAELDQAVRATTVLGFSIIGAPRRELAPAASALEGAGEVHLDRAFDYPGLASMTVAPLEQSKWDGVVAYCIKCGLDAARVLAVADGPNDVELLVNASVAVVPSNAHPAALEQADRLIPPARQGGWKAVLDLI